MVIREYQPADRADCLAAFCTHVPLFFTSAEISQYEHWLDSLSQEPDSYYYVVINKDKIVGCGGFGYDQSSHQAILAWGLISRDYQKQGWGKQLLEYRLERIGELYPQASIALDTTQHSYHFFQKYGFVIELITPNGYASGMDRYDMALKQPLTF